MLLPKLKFTKENFVLVGVVLVTITIPLTIVLLGVRQELRKGAAGGEDGSILINNGGAVTASREVVLTIIPPNSFVTPTPTPTSTRLSCLSTCRRLGFPDILACLRSCRAGSLPTPTPASPFCTLTCEEMVGWRGAVRCETETDSQYTGCSVSLDKGSTRGNVSKQPQCESFTTTPICRGLPSGTHTVRIAVSFSGGDSSWSCSDSLDIHCGGVPYVPPSDGPGAIQMMIGEDVDFESDYVFPYALSKDWSLSAGDGEKTVWVKFRGGDGVWTTPVSDSIVLDTSGSDLTPTPTRGFGRPTPTTVPNGPTPTPTRGFGRPTPTPVPIGWEAADLNGDGVLDTSDFAAFLDAYNQSGENLSGDLDGDGVVTILDITIFIGLYRAHVLGR